MIPITLLVYRADGTRESLRDQNVTPEHAAQVEAVARQLADLPGTERRRVTLIFDRPGRDPRNLGRLIPADQIPTLIAAYDQPALAPTSAE